MVICLKLAVLRHKMTALLLQSYLGDLGWLGSVLFHFPMTSIRCDKEGIKLIPALINMITGNEAKALEPAMIYIVNNTKFGRRLANPDQSIGVIPGTPVLKIESAYGSE